MTETDAPVREGDILAGKYRVERVLGAGGMGVVVAATHVTLAEKVAIKFLLPRALGSVDTVARFEREARAAVKIKSEHVAHVIDVGTLENGAPYLVMEYLEGGDLADWLRDRGPMPVEQAAGFVLQACVAIAEAHALGIVHRDLKPANLFCIRRADGVLAIKVLDFGISKLTGEAWGPDAGMTKTQALMGSPLYMSPEQVHSAKLVDARTDIWALGVILFELVSGSLPFNGTMLSELVQQIVHAPTPSLRGLVPHAPPGFEQVVLGCLEKDRERRYADVGQLARALAPFSPAQWHSVERITRTVQGGGIAIEEQRPSDRVISSRAVSVAPKGLTTSTVDTWGKTAPAPAKKRGPMVGVVGVVGVLAVAAVGGGTWVSLHRAQTPPSAARPDPGPSITTASTAPPALPTSRAAVSSEPAPAASTPVAIIPAVSSAFGAASSPRATGSPVAPHSRPAAPDRARKPGETSAPATSTRPAATPAPQGDFYEHM